MRLISDEDLKDRASEYCLSEDEYRRFCKIIDAEPTACNMDNLRKIAMKEEEQPGGIWELRGEAVEPDGKFHSHIVKMPLFL